MQKKEKQILSDFRTKIQKKLASFVKDETMFLEFSPMEKVFRQLIHNLADDSGLYAQSFGIEGENRYIVVYKKDYELTDDEILARKNGDGWNDEIKKDYALKRKLDEEETKEEEEAAEKEREAVKQDSNKKSNTKNRSKFEHSLASEAKAINETNKQYGFVPSENKKDLRSIEQTLADIQQKKKLKTQHNSNNTGE